MILSMNSQIKLFLMTLLIGLGTGFTYDIVKIIRKVIRHNNIVVQVEDFTFWIVISTGVFYIMLNANSGQIRGFCIGGALLGMALYSILLSKFVVKTSVAVIDVTLKVLIRVLRVIIYPIKVIWKIIMIPLVYNIFAPHLGKITRGTKKYLYMSKRYAKIRGRRFRNNLRVIFKKI